MMKMFVAIVLFAAFALPAASASARQDVITLTAYEELLKSGASTDGMTKTVISNPLLEEALVSYSNIKYPCRGRCVTGGCLPNCYCDAYRACRPKSLEDTNSAAANPLLEEALVAFAKKGNLGGLPICGETCLLGKCYTKGCSCGKYKICYKKSLDMED